jgi:hypothetical protein
MSNMSNMSNMSKQFNYGPSTPHTGIQANTNIYNNFQNAFTPNTPIIDAPDYINRKQVLHNNLGEKLFSERVVEYRAIMHSGDRDRLKFPSPFFMQVSFGNSNVEPNIDESMTNVKYVTLNNVWVPRTVAIDTSKIDIQNKIYDINPVLCGSHSSQLEINSDSLGLRPYLLLKVKELDDKHLMGTSPILKRDSFMIVPDQRIGDMYIFKPKRSTVVYSNSSLKNLNMFTLQLLNEKGKQIEIVDQNGKKIIGQNISSNVPFDYNKFVEKYIENKFVEHTDCSMQVIYDFTFGIIENELSTQTNYNKV